METSYFDMRVKQHFPTLEHGHSIEHCVRVVALNLHLLQYAYMDVGMHMSLVKIHLVCKATAIHAIHVAPGNRCQLATCTFILGKSVSI